MTERDRTAAENAALRARISALSAASLRISASLDLETVLNEVVDSARALTGARFGAIATIDETGTPRDFVTSGFTETEHRRLAEWSDGPRLFEHFRDLEGPLRIADVPAYVRALGFPTDRLPSKTFQGTPMRHRGVHVGNFFLSDKDNGEAFTDADEEILVLFASQAATAIANARTHRAERRARADLEALVETSPVGVVVFDAMTGNLISLNREAPRIVKSLCGPGQSTEQLLGVITCRRGDGREIALDRLPLAGALSGAETVRAEEVELSVPDGRSVTMLINATPIHAEDGAFTSVVVTMQDLAPLQDLERMQTEFLGMVSHELRTPLAAIKGSTAAVLGASRLVAPAETREFLRIIDDQADRMIGLIADLLDAGRIEAGTLSVSSDSAAASVSAWTAGSVEAHVSRPTCRAPAGACGGSTKAAFRPPPGRAGSATPPSGYPRRLARVPSRPRSGSSGQPIERSQLAARGESPAAFDRRCIPAGRRCSSVTYAQYAPSSRLARRAHHRSRCYARFHHGLLDGEIPEMAGGAESLDRP